MRKIISRAKKTCFNVKKSLKVLILKEKIRSAMVRRATLKFKELAIALSVARLTIAFK